MKCADTRFSSCGLTATSYKVGLAVMTIAVYAESDNLPLQPSRRSSLEMSPAWLACLSLKVRMSIGCMRPQSTDFGTEGFPQQIRMANLAVIGNIFFSNYGRLEFPTLAQVAARSTVLRNSTQTWSVRTFSQTLSNFMAKASSAMSRMAVSLDFARAMPEILSI